MKGKRIRTWPRMREFLVMGIMFPAFHAGDRGSNPLGDATKITKGYVEKRSPFLVLR